MLLDLVNTMPVEMERLFKSISEQMSIEFDFITSQFTHRGLRGQSRESTLNEFLGQYLPKKIGIGTGEIVSVNGRVSGQQDVVLYDTINCPTLYDRGGIQIFPSEGVFSVISVKSNLDSTQLLDCVNNISSVKRLPKTEYFPQGAVIHDVTYLYGNEYDHFPTLGFVFAYDSINLNTLKNRLIEINEEQRLPIDKRIDMICVLKKGIIYNIRTGPVVQGTPTPDSTLCYSESEDSLLFFYLLLMQLLTQAQTRPIKLNLYASQLSLIPRT